MQSSENQDAFFYQANPPTGHPYFALVADGVSNAPESQRWARILIDAAIGTPTALVDPKREPAWLASARAIFASETRTMRLAQPSSATMGCVAVDDRASRAGSRPWHFWCVGDIQLFLIEDGVLQGSWPAKKAADMPRVPDQLQSSRPGSGDPSPVSMEGEISLGASLVIASDSISEYLLRVTAENQEATGTAYFPVGYLAKDDASELQLLPRSYAAASSFSPARMRRSETLLANLARFGRKFDADLRPDDYTLCVLTNGDR